MSAYPILQDLIERGHITLLGDRLIGHASDGVAVLIGEDTPRGLAAAERYLTDFPEPSDW